MSKKERPPSIAPLSYQYSCIRKEEIPEKYNLYKFDYKKDDIDKYEVLFFYRLLKINYGFPYIPPIDNVMGKPITKELIDKLSANNNLRHSVNRLAFLDADWKYFIRTDAGIIEISTESRHASLNLYFILPEHINKPTQSLIGEGKRFVDALLLSAKKADKDNLLNLEKEFEEGGKLWAFALENVYFSNYISAEMMFEYAKENEPELVRQFFDKPDEARAHKEITVIGMFYAAAISYYFMAIEGFINLIYYSLLNNDLRRQDLEKRIEKMDIDLKLLLMPSLCNGFKSKMVNIDSEYYSRFIKLRDYRNRLFHSKTIDSLKTITILEDGLCYFIRMSKKYSKDIIPRSRLELKGEHVISIKTIVDELINDILNLLNKETRKEVEFFVIKSHWVPFRRDKDGKLILGLD
jgi:hypothetical protein